MVALPGEGAAGAGLRGSRSMARMAARPAGRSRRASCQPRSPGRPGWCGQVPCTVVDAEAVSSLSAVTLLAVTFAASLTVPGLVAVTVMVTVTLAPAARVPTVQLTVPPLVGGELPGLRVHEPWVAVAELKCALAGSVSMTVTPVASDPPVLVAVSV